MTRKRYESEYIVTSYCVCVCVSSSYIIIIINKIISQLRNTFIYIKKYASPTSLWIPLLMVQSTQQDGRISRYHLHNYKMINNVKYYGEKEAE